VGAHFVSQCGHNGRGGRFPFLSDPG
jgi:hypothetical protein